MGIAKKHTPDQIGIYRYFHSEINSYCVAVGVRRNGKFFQKRFYESRCGGQRATLQLAQAWRDTIIAAHPAMSLAKFSTILRSNNTSGVAGVSYTKRTIRSKDGSVHDSPAWVARIPLSSGKIRTFTFMVRKYGEEGAKQRAIDARQQGLAVFEKTAFRMGHVPLPVSSSDDIAQLHALLNEPEERRKQRDERQEARRQAKRQRISQRRLNAQIATRQIPKKTSNSEESNIYRCVTASGNNGYHVNIVRQKQRHNKYFSDSVYGSAAAALEVAKVWRDQIFSTLPVISKAQYVTRIQTTNTSGVAGVSMRKRKIKGVQHEYWIAYAPKYPGHSRHTKSFSVGKFGEREAFALAVKARQAFVAEL